MADLAMGPPPILVARRRRWATACQRWIWAWAAPPSCLPRVPHTPAWCSTTMQSSVGVSTTMANLVWVTPTRAAMVRAKWVMHCPRCHWGLVLVCVWWQLLLVTPTAVCCCRVVPCSAGVLAVMVAWAVEMKIRAVMKLAKWVRRCRMWILALGAQPRQSVLGRRTPV